jgi:hypothetical protein
MPDVATFQMPVELRLKLGAVVGLHHADTKGQAPPHVIKELYRRALVEAS